MFTRVIPIAQFDDRILTTNDPIRASSITRRNTYELFPLGLCKNVVYKRRYDNLEDLQQSIIQVINNIDDGIIAEATRSVYNGIKNVWRKKMMFSSILFQSCW